MTEFTPEQLALLKEKIRFTGKGFDIVGHMPGNVWGHVDGNVGGDVVGDVGGYVAGNVQGVGGTIGQGWMREEPANNPEIPDSSEDSQ